MKALNLLIPILLIFNCSCSSPEANIEGDWVWDFTSKLGEHHHVELNLIQKDGLITGSYCSQYNEGLKVDCNDSKEKQNFNLKQTGSKTFEGDFFPNSEEDYQAGRIKITYSKKLKGILVDLQTEPGQSFLFPDEVMFYKK